jgi:two-component system, chemotaxis family, CheB/CheR fusion protein
MEDYIAVKDKPNSKEKTQSPRADDNTLVAPEAEFHIVGIGASAGGLAALEIFFTHMPDYLGSKTSFVLVQHLPPDYKSILGELLEQCTSLHICEAEDGIAVAPHSIYVAPANRDLTIRGSKLYLREPETSRSLRFPIDVFFRSLAEDQKERSICIILSGGGSDGTQGLKAVKGEAGMVMAQVPDSAEHKSMPYSAIATGMVDYVLPPDEMPGQLADYLQNTLQREPLPAEPRVTGKVLSKIFNLLYSKTGHDLSGYKQATIARRIERRLVINQIENLDDYLHYLQQSPEEAEALFKEFMVGVTRFFRDPEAYNALVEKVIPHLFAGRSPGDTVRIWVPGCSTGEEAYSLAILLREYMNELKQPLRVQIFATDIDSRAIAQARQGIYPASIAIDVSPRRLKSFFAGDADCNTFRIQKTVRDMIVFAEHNVTRDPPFSGLDLISCRNLLIYMDTDLQKRVLHLFHYALNPDSFLFLGVSETPRNFNDLFSTVDRKWKLFQSKANPKFHSPKKLLPLFKQTTSCSPSAVPPTSKNIGIPDLVNDMLLQRHTPACVAINRHGEIIYIHGRTGKYLEPAPGEVSLNITQMAREGLKLELAAAIRKAAAQKMLVYCRGLQVKGNGGTTATVNLTVSPFLEKPPDLADLLLVVFEEIVFPEGEDRRMEVAAAVEEAAAAVETAADLSIADLERELRDKEEYLQTVIEELESSNEELQSTGEEYQSANEELMTSREELQSVNEELTTVNAELQQKNDELSRTNNDMNNMLTGTGVGFLFVDHQLRIQRFTPSAAAVINLIQSDLGRPISHFTSNLLDYDQLEEDVQGVLDTLMKKELEVRAKNELCYLMRILPYRTLDNVIEGAVITFTDITELKRLQEISRLAVVVRDSNDAITVQDLEGQILAWNPGAEKIYGWSEAEALEMNIRETVPENKRAEALEKVLRLAHSENLEPFKTERLTRNGGSVEVWITATALVNEDGTPYAVATTERRAAEA